MYWKQGCWLGLFFPIYLSIYLSICLSVCLSLCLYLHWSIYPSIHLFISLFLNIHRAYLDKTLKTELFKVRFLNQEKNAKRVKVLFFHISSLSLKITKHYNDKKVLLGCILTMTLKSYRGLMVLFRSAKKLGRYWVRKKFYPLETRLDHVRLVKSVKSWLNICETDSLANIWPNNRGAVRIFKGQGSDFKKGHCTVQFRPYIKCKF